MTLKDKVVYVAWPVAIFCAIGAMVFPALETALATVGIVDLLVGGSLAMGLSFGLIAE